MDLDVDRLIGSEIEQMFGEAPPGGHPAKVWVGLITGTAHNAAFTCSMAAYCAARLESAVHAGATAESLDVLLARALLDVREARDKLLAALGSLERMEAFRRACTPPDLPST